MTLLVIWAAENRDTSQNIDNIDNIDNIWAGENREKRINKIQIS